METDQEKKVDQDKERKAERSRRMLEKAMRMPLNDTIIQIQDGVIKINALFQRIKAKVKEGKENG